MKDYYEILEVNEHASKEVIEKAYRVLIKKYHPDLYVGEERTNIDSKARDINEAYRILSDDFLREQYDRELEKTKLEQYIKGRKENEKTKKNKNNISIRKNNQNEKAENSKNIKNSKNKTEVGSISSNIELLKEIFKNKPKKINIRNFKKEDWIAIGITIAIMLVLGIILWFIPFTNSFMRELTVENPLFSWIGKVFQK